MEQFVIFRKHVLKHAALRMVRLQMLDRRMVLVAVQMLEMLDPELVQPATLVAKQERRKLEPGMPEPEMLEQQLICERAAFFQQSH